MPDSEFSVWYDVQEQWDPEHIDPPALRCTAPSHSAAAAQLADNTDDFTSGVFIVRDEATGVYRDIELIRDWVVKSDVLITLADLCAP